MAEKTLPTKLDRDREFTPTAKGRGARKTDNPPAPRPIRGKRIIKRPADAEIGKATRSMGGGKPPILPDQQGPRRRRSTKQYLRLTVRVDDGEMSIIDSHLVDSPLLQSSTFLGSYVYEVTDGSRLIHAGSLPDLGVVRSFAAPGGTGPLLGHHTYDLSTYEFDVRIPTEALTRQALPKLEIAVYRIKDKFRPGPLLDTPLSIQRERELREVARVVGVPRSFLPKGIGERGLRKR
jgi:hypothetical protein